MIDEKELLAERMNSIITRIYIEEDYDLCFRLCEENGFELPQEIVDFSKSMNITIDDINGSNHDPRFMASQWVFHFPDFRKGENLTQYDTFFAVSKLCNVFYIQHKFHIKDLNPDSYILNSMLDGEGYVGDPVTYAQSDLTRVIVKEMKKRDFLRMDFSDAKQIFCGNDFCRLKKFLNKGPWYVLPGAYPTVSYYNLLFFDMMGLHDLRESGSDDP